LAIPTLGSAAFHCGLSWLIRPGRRGGRITLMG
jgi:hypothetical protein